MMMRDVIMVLITTPPFYGTANAVHGEATYVGPRRRGGTKAIPNSTVKGCLGVSLLREKGVSIARGQRSERGRAGYRRRRTRLGLAQQRLTRFLLIQLPVVNFHRKQHISFSTHTWRHRLPVHATCALKGAHCGEL